MKGYCIYQNLSCLWRMVHNYSMFLNEKKEALQKFAEERGYKWLWLTPSFSIDFRKIYRSIISGKNSYTYKKLE